MQFLAGAKVIEGDQRLKLDRVLFSDAQEPVGMLIILGHAVAYVMSGMYGDVSDLGTGNAILLITQLSAAGAFVLHLDELLQNGYGMGSGISLFTATSICEGKVTYSRGAICPRGRSVRFS